MAKRTAPAQRKKIVIVCAHLDVTRSAERERDFMQPSAGLQIASLFDRERYDVTLYHEMWHGPFDTARTPDADLVFLTGLQRDFDRQRQLAYFFKQRGAITVAGGSVCTLFPDFATRFFDVVCAGGIDSVRDVIADYERGTLRATYSSPQTRLTDYRVDYRILRESGIRGALHLIEASRGCNFRCDFCAIPAEKARHTPYGTARVLRAIDDSIAASPWFSLKRRYPLALFIDNNFANNPAELRELCAALKRHRRLKGWAALVTQDVLRNRNLVQELARSKCLGLFTGLESLDPEFLKKHDKTQNMTRANSLLDDVAFAQRQGIVIMYGYLFDPRMTTTAEMSRQIEAVLAAETLPFPSFFSFVAPLLGTKLFWESVELGELRPNVRVRDLDGQSVSYRNCRSSDAELTALGNAIFQRLDRIAGPAALVRRSLKTIFATGWRRPMFWFQTYVNNLRAGLRRPPGPGVIRTYIAGTDGLNPQYGCTPSDVSPENKRRFFDPVMVTDENGDLAEWLEPYRPARAASAKAVATGV
jgi:radical SAM superfamily enzyme YgiQ (UPF0313 family)